METKKIHPTMSRIFSITNLYGTDLAKEINESPQTIYNWEKRGISKTGAFAISNKFKIDLKWILTGEGRPEIENSTHNISLFKDNCEDRVFVKSHSKIDSDGYYSELECSSDKVGYISSPISSSNAYAIKITSDYMHPAIRQGWFVICDQSKSPVSTEFVEVILKDGRRTIKEFLGVSSGLLHLLSVNTEKRTTFEIEDVEAIVAITNITPPSLYIQDQEN